MAEADVRLGGRSYLRLLLPAFQFYLVDTRAQHSPGGGPVLVLRPFILTLHDDAGRQMGDAHGAVSRVDVLAAGAARAVGVDAHVLLVDVDGDGVVDGGIDRHRRKARMPPRIGIEG